MQNFVLHNFAEERLFLHRHDLSVSQRNGEKAVFHDLLHWNDFFYPAYNFNEVFVYGALVQDLIRYIIL